MTLNELLFVFPDNTLVNVTQASIAEPISSSALLLNKMLDKSVLNANVLRVEASCESRVCAIDVQIEDTFTVGVPKSDW